jgi:hypothetical protein
MKRLNHMFISFFLCLILILSSEKSLVAQGVSKYIRVGSFWAKVVDSGDEGEGSWGWGRSRGYYDGFRQGLFSSKAVFLGCKNFIDALDVFHAIKVSGHGQWESDNYNIWMPVPDDQGMTINRYMKYQPPAVIVNGVRVDEQYPVDIADHVDPGIIPGTADIMLESTINTDMGITVRQRVLAYSQENHDDYQIYEWKFINTGNIDLDDEIELTQTLEDVFFLRQLRYYENQRGWASSFGEMPGDDLRILYGYPARWSDAHWDNFGDVDASTGFIRHPWFMGEATLFGSDALDPLLDDENQPRMTGAQDVDLPVVTFHSNNLTEENRLLLYQLMEEGFSTYPGDGVENIAGSKPGNHSLRFDDRGYQFPDEAPWWGYTISGFVAYGPYTLAPNDSFTIVWAQVMGMISPQAAYDIGTEWLNGTCTWGNMIPGGSTDILPPQYSLYPGLYGPDLYSTELNNWAKDNWLFTGKDSLFQNSYAAEWAYDQNYNVPEAPPPPSIEVTSMENTINITWGNESEAAADFAGYRLYRAENDYYTHIEPGDSQLRGAWELIFECGEGTAIPITYSFNDVDVTTNNLYYYCVTAFDNGTGNPPDYHGNIEILESGKFLSTTWTGALAFADEPEHFTNVVTPTGRTQPVYISDAYLDGVQFQLSDEIGVYDGDLLVGAGIVKGFPMADPITVYLEYTPPGGDPLPGAQDGNDMLFKVWDRSDDREEDAEISEVVSGNPIFSEGAIVAVSLDAWGTQTIVIRPAFLNLISFNLRLVDPSAVAVFDPLPNLIIAQDDEGNLRIPPDIVFPGHPGTNTIDENGGIRVEKGYHVYISGDTEQSLQVKGSPLNLQNTWIPLNPNFLNKISFPSRQAMLVQNVFSASENDHIYNDLSIVQDHDGFVYTPPDVVYPGHPGSNTIDDNGGMQPGKGYMIYHRNEEMHEFTYPEPGESAVSKSIAKGEKEDTQHFTCIKTGEPHALFLRNINLNLEEGDELGVFADKKCVGSKRYLDNLDDPIVVWCAVPEYGLAGIKDGQKLEIQLWKQKAQSIEILNLAGDNVFHKKRIFSLVKISSGMKIDGIQLISDMIPKKMGLSKNYPNPFNPTTTIEISLNKDTDMSLVIYNIRGELVREVLSGYYPAGRYRVDWDGRNRHDQRVASGIYIYRLQADSYVKTRKMILVK